MEMIDMIDNKINKINIPVLIGALAFLLACFIDGRALLAYPVIVFILTLMEFDYGLQFVFFTLGINFAIFQNIPYIGPFHPNSFITIGQIAFLLAGISRVKRIRIDSKVKALSIFAIISLISLAYTPDTVNGVKVLANILLFPLTLLLFYNRDDVSTEKVFKLSVFTGLILWLFAYPLQYLVLKSSLFMYDLDRGFRFSGAGVHPVPLSFMMVLVFYSALYLYDKLDLKRYLLVAAAALVFAFMTQTRTAIIGLFVTMLIYLYHKRSLKFAIPVALLGVLLAYQSIVDFFLKKGAVYYQEGLSFFSGGRINFWVVSLQTFAQRPIEGAGLGSSAAVLSSTGIAVPHNDFVRVLLETGLLGFAPFIVYMCLQLADLIRWFKTHAVVLCLFVFFIIASLTDNLIDYNLYFTFPLFVLLGATNQAISRENKLRRTRETKDETDN
jgi:O-antigen ligase